jgi:parallel beta-helix repeat protein
LSDAQSGDTITFDPSVFVPTAPATIQLALTGGVLPHIIQDDITIDASNAGVILDGSALQDDDSLNGLEIESDGNVVKGLQIVDFPGIGLVICGGSYNTIGGDRRVGDGPIGEGNLVSGNHLGIFLCDAAEGSHNIITGNIVGTDPTATHDWGNQRVGILIRADTNTTVGPGNVIAYNGSAGVLVKGSGAFGNTITQNSIFDNSWGIKLWDGGNTMLAHPVIQDFDLDAGTVEGTACPNCTIEVFSASGLEGDIYEGRTTADDQGAFAFDSAATFAGPYVTATATDPDGNTSSFPMTINGYDVLQLGNSSATRTLEPSSSGELQDNRIGIHFSDLAHPQPEVFPDGTINADHILSQGVTRARLAVNDISSDNIAWDRPEIPIDPSADQLITRLADNGMTLTYVLTFWDKEYVAQGGELPLHRFKTEEEIQRYLDYVRYTVRELKDRVEYYEIWNEPDNGGPLQEIELEDYINLAVRAVPVIRQEYPDAKIVVGSVGPLHEQSTSDYFWPIIRSDDLMPLVDVVSWHGMYNTSPEYDLFREYYYGYPSMVEEIRQTAQSHGFTGEFVSDELSWRDRATPEPLDLYSTEIESAKYYARGILMHLGLGVAVSQFYAVPAPDEHPQLALRTIRNLSTVMAGAVPIDLTVSVESEAEDIVTYGFSLSNGDLLIALWADGVATDVDLGSEATVIVSGITAETTTVTDVVYGFEKELITDADGGNLVIRDLLVKDSPFVLRLSEVSLP